MRLLYCTGTASGMTVGDDGNKKRKPRETPLLMRSSKCVRATTPNQLAHSTTLAKILHQSTYGIFE